MSDRNRDLVSSNGAPVPLVDEQGVFRVTTVPCVYGPSLGAVILVFAESLFAMIVLLNAAGWVQKEPQDAETTAILLNEESNDIE